MASFPSPAPAAAASDVAQSPIVVTGMARSGTSWVGKLLQASGEVTYINEPLNPDHPPGRSPGVLDAQVERHYQYISEQHEDGWLAAFDEMLQLRYHVGAELRQNRSPYDLARMAKYATGFLAGRLLGRRALLDDPYTLLAAEWLADRLGCRVVVIVRDPAAMVASWRRLGWTTDLGELLHQPALIVTLQEGRTVRLAAAGRVGTADALILQPGAALEALRPGSELSVDFNGALLRVVEAGPAGVTALVLEGGQVRSNKAVTVDPVPALPPLTGKDVEAIAIASSLGVRQFALSFASRAEDVAMVRGLLEPGATVISKIESRAGIRNMDNIISASDAVLIDRGDLSREIPLEHVPFYQKVVVRQANRWNRPVFVATNLLESMVTSRRATVAEADDIANTLMDGVHGLVLAAETAIGVDPVGTVDMVLRVVAAFERWNMSSLLEEDRIAYQLGLLLLMYCSGTELRALLSRGERKPILGIAVVGNVVPFLAGLAFLGLYDTSRFLGPAGDRFSFGLIFALAIAVTSIPVISRIMADLGILGSRFARVVLSVAVLEDLVIYVVLNIALARVAAGSAETSGLLGILGLESGGNVAIGYHIAVTLGFFLLPVVAGPGLVQRLADWPGNLLQRASPIAFQLVFMLTLAGLASFVGVAPIFGALVAGILAGDLRGESLEARRAISGVSSATLVPLYFAVVGLRLDLVGSFEPWFFLFLLGFACLVKSVSCYVGARLVGEGRSGARNLAVALNARGGPGIVLASVALDARIIDDSFYTMLVMLALVTSVIAGSWLEVVLKRGKDLLSGEPDDGLVAGVAARVGEGPARL